MKSGRDPHLLKMIVFEAYSHFTLKVMEYIVQRVL